MKSNQLRGFTLIELIIVIILLAVVSVGVFSYIGFSANVYVSAVKRDQITSQSRFAVERLTRELRDSLPRSQRVRGSDNSRCVEMVPIWGSSSYLSIPLPSNPGEDFVGVEPRQGVAGLPANSQLVVFATRYNHIYRPNSRRKKSDLTTSAGPKPGLVEFNYSDSTQFFPTESPAQRYYIVVPPVSWCVEGNELRRYTNYGWFQTQRTGAFLASNASYEVMAVGITNDVTIEQPFHVTEASLRRTAVVQIDFRFATTENEPLKVLHEVHVPNVP